MTAWIKQLPVGPMANFAYLLGDSADKGCVVIDPGWEGERILQVGTDNGYNIEAIWLTHTHFDHIGAVEPLLEKVDVPLLVHELEACTFAHLKDLVRCTRDGDPLQVGTVGVQCLHTPGHTPGGQCFVGEGFVFTGDTLFVDSIGRTDLPGSDPEQMFSSLKRLSHLPPGTVVYSGHNYGREPTTTIGEQVKRNPYMQCRTVGEFLRR
ncbi:MAG: MBL fold metallo-hydrolase [Deltaproteobacteria bacterium]|nr:MBL fold metallo-hydrolase [Deltaproteobacteria bacterium]